MEGKVSIVSACYNGENYVSRFLEAILNQTYSAIQLIVVDDGSQDNTLEILRSFTTRFVQKNMEYIVLSQKNGGQASALNYGFQYVDGDYITWPDSDDFLYEDSVEKRVSFLEKHPEFGMVLSSGDEYTAECDKKIRENVVSRRQAENLMDCMTDMTAMFNNNGYLVRSSILWEIYPQRKIYENRAGQNIQLLLPLSTTCRCGYFPQSLYGRTIRGNSHSKQQTDIIKRMNQINDIYYHTIAGMHQKRSYVAARYALYDLYSKSIEVDIEQEKRETVKQLHLICRTSIRYCIKLFLRRIKLMVWRK